MEERYKILAAIRNPLPVIALFVLSVEITASIVMTSSSLTEEQRYWFVVFCTIFPLLVFAAFFFITWKHPEHFYGPSDYNTDNAYLQAMKKGKIEDEVTEIVQSEETQAPASRMQVTGWVANAEHLAIEQLLNEFNCPISRQLMSRDRSFLFDAVIHKGREWIFVDVKYVRRNFISPTALNQIKRFANAASDNPKILAIVTPEPLNDVIRAKYKSKIEEIDKSIELRYYVLKDN